MKTLLDVAKANLDISKRLMDEGPWDELTCNIAAFHLQQAAEMAIKYQLEQEGVEYPKTHMIEKLCDVARRAGVSLGITDYIEDHAEMLSAWEAQSRYVLDYSVEIKKIKKAIPEVEKSIEQIKNIITHPFQEGGGGHHI